MEFTSDRKARFDEILRRYPVKRSAILPALHMAQDQEGYLTTGAMEYIARLLDLTPAQVYDTASYYAMFRFRPWGQKHIEVCTNLSCALKGADGLIERFGLTEVVKSQARFLSGGERRKLEIARAMVTNPSLILLDEPFSGVDPITVQELQQEIRRLTASGVSILITDHNVERTLEVVDKAYIIDHGKVIAQGSPREIVQNELVRKSYLGSTFRGDEFD